MTENFWESKYIAKWKEERAKKEEWLDRQTIIEKLTKINNIDNSICGRGICPCCFRADYIFGTEIENFLERVCGGIPNIDDVRSVRPYISITLKDPSLFRARKLEGSGFYAYKYEIENALTGRLVLLVPDIRDADIIKEYIDEAIKNHDYWEEKNKLERRYYG